MRIQFLGSGDAFGSGGRFNTCFHVTTGGAAKASTPERSATARTGSACMPIPTPIGGPRRARRYLPRENAIFLSQAGFQRRDAFLDPARRSLTAPRPI